MMEMLKILEPHQLMIVVLVLGLARELRKVLHVYLAYKLWNKKIK